MEQFPLKSLGTLSLPFLAHTGSSLLSDHRCCLTQPTCTRTPRLRLSVKCHPFTLCLPPPLKPLPLKFSFLSRSVSPTSSLAPSLAYNSQKAQSLEQPSHHASPVTKCFSSLACQDFLHNTTYSPPKKFLSTSYVYQHTHSFPAHTLEGLIT